MAQNWLEFSTTTSGPLFLTLCLSFSLYPMAMSEIEREQRKDAGETEGGEGEGGGGVFFSFLAFMH